MNKLLFTLLQIICIVTTLNSCRAKMQYEDDKVYSRHLQKHVSLGIGGIRLPKTNEPVNLLLFTGDDEKDLKPFTRVLTTLMKDKSISSLLIVGIREGNNMFGLSAIDKNAANFNEFVRNELLAYIRKKSGIRKFNKVAIWGYGKAGISAFDIGWENADKFDIVGISSANWDYAGIKDSTITSLETIRTSRKRPALRYFIDYRPNDSLTVSLNRKFVKLLMEEKNNSGKSTFEVSVVDHQDKNLPDEYAALLAFIKRALPRI